MPGGIDKPSNTLEPRITASTSVEAAFQSRLHSEEKSKPEQNAKPGGFVSPIRQQPFSTAFTGQQKEPTSLPVSLAARLAVVTIKKQRIIDEGKPFSDFSYALSMSVYKDKGLRPKREDVNRQASGLIALLDERAAKLKGDPTIKATLEEALFNRKGLIDALKVWNERPDDEAAMKQVRFWFSFAAWSNQTLGYAINHREKDAVLAGAVVATTPGGAKILEKDTPLTRLDADLKRIRNNLHLSTYKGPYDIQAICYLKEGDRLGYLDGLKKVLADQEMPLRHADDAVGSAIDALKPFHDAVSQRSRTVLETTQKEIQKSLKRNEEMAKLIPENRQNWIDNPEFKKPDPFVLKTRDNVINRTLSEAAKAASAAEVALTGAQAVLDGKPEVTQEIVQKL